MGRTRPEAEPAGEERGPGRPALSSRHRRTLEAVFKRPTRPDIPWRDIEALLGALGASKIEGRGSRVQFALGGRKATFHRPHPRKETNKGAVEAACRLLAAVGVVP